jgi:hypothetical protein
VISRRDIWKVVGLASVLASALALGQDVNVGPDGVEGDANGPMNPNGAPPEAKPKPADDEAGVLSVLFPTARRGRAFARRRSWPRRTIPKKPWNSI